MNPEKIGKFICELRKEKNLSQYQLADIIPISRQGVSKWERGKTTPDPQTLLRLSEIFDVSINELLVGERLPNNSIEALEETTLSILDQSNKKTKLIKRILLVSTIIIVTLLLAFLSYYFINSYNTIEVYKIGGKSKNFITHTGIFMTTKEKYYLRLGKIDYVGDIQIESIKLYYKINNKRKVIVEDNNIDNITIEEHYGYEEKIKKSKINKIKENLYLEITYNNNQKETIKLKYRRDYSNSSLFFIKQKELEVKPEINEEKQENDKTENVEEIKEEIKPVVQEIKQDTQQENKKEKVNETKSEPEVNQPEQSQELIITTDMAINKIKELCQNDNGTYTCDYDNSNTTIMYHSIMNKIALYKNGSMVGQYFANMDNYMCTVENCETIFNEVYKQYLFQ